MSRLRRTLAATVLSLATFLPAGFASAADYYHRASALRVIDRIRVPALILTAADDPFVPPEPFADPAVTSNPNVEVVLTRHGGHCGFISEPAPGDDGYWAETRIVGMATAVCGRDEGP